MKRRQPSRSPKYRDYTEPVKDPDGAARPPSKKPKSANRGRSTPNMAAFDFQTPHPTLGSQSQTFRLPSSSPQPLSRPLSPVPTATSSKHFKENAPKRDKLAIDPEASSMPWTRHSSNPFASMMRPKPLSRKSRPRAGRHRPSRSHSRSSSNSNVSSRANSKERKSVPPPNTHPASTLKHTQSLSALDHTKTNPAHAHAHPHAHPHPHTHPKPKQGPRKSAAPKPAPRPSLASPFVSRASSPVRHAGSAPHIPTTPPRDAPPHTRTEDAPRKSSARSALRDLRTPDPNLPPSAPIPHPTNPTDSTHAPPLHPAPWLQNVRSSLDNPSSAAAHTLHPPKKINLIDTTAAARSAKRPGARGETFSLYARRQQAQAQHGGRDRDRDRDGNGNGTGTGERARRPSAPSSLHPAKALRARLSVLGPGRAPGGGEGTADGQRGVLGAPVDLVDAEAKEASGVLLDESRPRPPSTATQDDARRATDDAPSMPPPATGPLHPALQTSADALAVSSFRRLLHPSASLDDLHSTDAQGRADNHHNPSADNHRAVAAARDDDDDDRTAWMHARAGVDFNRPPSQMDVAAGVGFGVFEETFFTSSEDDDDDDDESRSEDGAEEDHAPRLRKPELRARRSSSSLGLHSDIGVNSGAAFGFGFGFLPATGARRAASAFGDREEEEGDAWMRFGEDALGVSTPAHDLPRPSAKTARGAVRRVLSLPSLREGPVKLKGSANAVAGGAGVLARSVSYDDLQAYQRDAADEDGDGEEDMELTGSAAGGARVREGEEDREEEREEDWDDAVSWITDSLISAPSIYLERKRQKAAMQQQQDLDPDQDEDEDEDEDGDRRAKEGKSSSSTLDGPSYRSPFRLSGGPGLQDERSAAGDLLPAADAHAGAYQQEGSEDHDAHSSGSYTRSSSSSGASSKTATRTRSGTIVPLPSTASTTPAAAANSTNPIPPGSRRTRSGTIVGPLPPAPPPAFALPARPDGSVGGAHARVGKAPVRTRSGTIVASASVGVDGSGAHGPAHGYSGRARSGSVVQMPSFGMLAADADGGQEAEDGVECYTDSLYLPDASSPDPIDFLRFAGIAEAENEDDEDGEEWRVVRAPPSPGTRKARQQQQPRGRGAFRGLATRWLGKGKAAARKGVPARKGGGVEEDEDEDALGDAEDSSEDELLLVPGATATFWS